MLKRRVTNSGFVPRCGHLAQEHAARCKNGRSGEAAAQHQIDRRAAAKGRPCRSTQRGGKSEFAASASQRCRQELIDRLFLRQPCRNSSSGGQALHEIFRLAAVMIFDVFGSSAASADDAAKISEALD